MADFSGVPPIAVSVKDAAAMLGISQWAMYQILDDEAKPIVSRYKGTRRLVSVDSLRSYFETLPTEKPEPKVSA